MFINKPAIAVANNSTQLEKKYYDSILLVRYNSVIQSLQELMTPCTVLAGQCQLHPQLLVSRKGSYRTKKLVWTFDVDDVTRAIIENTLSVASNCTQLPHPVVLLHNQR